MSKTRVQRLINRLKRMRENFAFHEARTASQGKHELSLSYYSNGIALDEAIETIEFYRTRVRELPQIDESVTAKELK